MLRRPPGRAHSKRVTTSQVAPVQPRNHLPARPRPTSQPPLRSPPPNLAATTVGDGSSVADRRSEPHRRASIFLSGRAPSGQTLPCACVGETNELRYGFRSIGCHDPPSSSPLQAENDLSARPRPTSPRPLSSTPPNLATTSVGDGSSVADRRSEPDRRASIFLSGRAPSGQTERASSSRAERRADHRDRSVSEVAGSGEDHGGAGGVDGLDDVGVFDAAAGLDDGGDAVAEG